MSAAQGDLFAINGEVRKSAMLSLDEGYRYDLVRDWSDPNRFVRQFATFVMLNPSTADAEHDDPTIQRCMKFARAWGLDGIRVVNLYAYRTSKPENLWSALAAGRDVVGPENDAYVNTALMQAYNTDAPVIVAWGNHGALGRVEWLVRHARGCQVQLQCLGTTQSGAPIHPSARGKHRVPGDVELRPWTEACA